MEEMKLQCVCVVSLCKSERLQYGTNVLLYAARISKIRRSNKSFQHTDFHCMTNRWRTRARVYRNNVVMISIIIITIVVVVSGSHSDNGGTAIVPYMKMLKRNMWRCVSMQRYDTTPTHFRSSIIFFSSVSVLHWNHQSVYTSQLLPSTTRYHT